MESDYVRDSVGSALALGLAEVALIRPPDPVEYLGLWLLKHKRNLEESEERKKYKLLQAIRAAELAQKETQPPVMEVSTLSNPATEQDPTLSTNDDTNSVEPGVTVTKAPSSRQGSRPPSRLSRIEEESIVVDTNTT